MSFKITKLKVLQDPLLDFKKSVGKKGMKAFHSIKLSENTVQNIKKKIIILKFHLAVNSIKNKLKT